MECPDESNRLFCCSLCTVRRRLGRGRSAPGGEGAAGARDDVQRPLFGGRQEIPGQQLEGAARRLCAHGRAREPRRGRIPGSVARPAQMAGAAVPGLCVHRRGTERGPRERRGVARGVSPRPVRGRDERHVLAFRDAGRAGLEVVERGVPADLHVCRPEGQGHRQDVFLRQHPHGKRRARRGCCSSSSA